MEKKEIINQTKLAFSHIQNLYMETSYFIKEIEAQLAEEAENFVIGKPSGYSINARSSTGLEPRNVYLWTIKKLSVFFIPLDNTKRKGTTTTAFNEDTKALYVRVILDDGNIMEPQVYFGVLYGFGENGKLNKKFSKVEQVIAHIEYREKSILSSPKNIDYEDGYIKFKGKLQKASLFDINGSQEVNKYIIQPVLKLFRSIN